MNPTSGFQRLTICNNILPMASLCMIVPGAGPICHRQLRRQTLRLPQQVFESGRRARATVSTVGNVYFTPLENFKADINIEGLVTVQALCCATFAEAATCGIDLIFSTALFKKISSHYMTNLKPNLNLQSSSRKL